MAYYMKIIICTMALIFAGVSADAQKISIAKSYIVLSDDHLSIDKAFSKLEDLLPSRFFYFDRYVIHQGKTYYRPGITLFRKSTYIVDNGNLIRLHTL